MTRAYRSRAAADLAAAVLRAEGLDVTVFCTEDGVWLVTARPVDRRGETTLIAGLLAGLIAVATLVAASAGLPT